MISPTPGDIAFFWGRGFLPWAIETFTHRGPSHCSMFIDPALVVDDGAGLGGPYTVESTIIGCEDGVQITSFPIRSANYDGSIAVAHLRQATREKMDFPRMWDMVRAKVNRDNYNKLELGQYLARKLPILEWLPQDPNPGAEVCSELVMMLLALSFPGLDPFRTNPQRVLEMNIFASVEWIHGTPQTLRKFNTR